MDILSPLENQWRCYDCLLLKSHRLHCSDHAENAIMKKLLILKSSFMGAQSQTNALIDSFIAERKAKGLNDQVRERDLVELNLPVLDSELFHALRGASPLSERAQAVVRLSDELIDELKESDLVVIAAPMYNHNVPTHLKNWFDLVARAGVTFKYTESYPMGLVNGVSAVVISTRGGEHVGQETDAVTPYLKSVLGLIGIGDVRFIYAEGLDKKPLGRAKGLEDALHQIRQLVA